MELDKAISILRAWVEVDRKTRKLKEINNDFNKLCEEKNIAIERVIEALGEEYARGYHEGANDIIDGTYLNYR